MQKETGISTRQLHIGYRSDLISNISIAVRPGRIVTLIGPNGCGKTTLIRTLTGHLALRGGTVFLDGADRSSLSVEQIAKTISVVMTQRRDPGLMTCREVVEIGRYPYTGRLGILSKEDQRIVSESMEWTDVAKLSDTLFETLSDGQKQRVLLARAICQQPKVLILDEPTSFLDIRHKLDLLQKIMDYAKQKQVAILMSLHELEIARSISDTIVALGEGAVLRIGTPKEVFTETFIRRLYHLEDMDTRLLGSMPWMEEAGVGDKHTEDPHAENTDAEDIRAGEAEKEKAGFFRTDTKQRHAKVIMIQGTMSNAGKSVIAAALCRIFSDDGYRVMPFKSQNMALNSFITREGLEMGRAQVMQAECARQEPTSAMNPILLKPTGSTGSQVIVNGRVIGNMSAAEYYRRKKEFKEDILRAYETLDEMADIIVIEGAGSPVEMNLKKDDIVNMGLAALVDAPVLLVGDIDRGGVFAQLLGTLDLLEAEERKRVKGLIVNKFRGDPQLFEDGVALLEQRSEKRVVGVLPLLDVRLDDEDSLTDRFRVSEAAAFDIAIIRLDHISNFTDFDPFEQVDAVSVRYVSDASRLGTPDLIILPGSKNTIGDLRRLKERGLADAVKKKAREGCTIIGICGGFQMLGGRIEDPADAEGGGTEEGLGLLPVRTILEKEKTTKQVSRLVSDATGVLSDLKGLMVEGYEIHNGRTTLCAEASEFTGEGSGYCSGNVYGTYLHGFFDRKEILETVLKKLAEANNKQLRFDELTDYAAYKQSQYDLLAKGVRESLDMQYIYKIMGMNHEDGGLAIPSDRTTE